MRLSPSLLLAVLSCCPLATFAANCTNPNTLNIGCASGHCAVQMVEAFEDPLFSKQLMPCITGCNCLYSNDTDPQRLQFVNCTTKCAFTYQSKPGQEFMKCAQQRQCMTFAPINVTCPVPKMKADTGLEVFAGHQWRQEWGWNRLFDAYPCQQIHNVSLSNNATFCSQQVRPDGTSIKAPCWHYDYSYDVFTETGLFHQRQVWQLPGNVPKGSPVEIFYTYAGSIHNETWTIIDANDRYVLLFDCSRMSGWTLAGSIIWVNAAIGKLTDDDMKAIGVAYAAAGFPESTGDQGWSFPNDFLQDRWETGCSPVRSYSGAITDKQRLTEAQTGMAALWA